jgi:hypothetical protein
MNKRDRDNLKFIMTADETTLRDWFRSVDEDDIDYAFELLKKASAELSLKEAELYDEVDDYTESDNVLARIMSK